MKLVKSGIEMDPGQMNEAKGTGCSCGCSIGVNGDMLNAHGGAQDACTCVCVTPIPHQGPNPTASAANIGSYAATFLQT